MDKSDTDLLRRTILNLVAGRGPGKSICPSEAARAIAGPDEKQWRLLMKPLRAEAVAMAKAGRIVILRKGKPVDPGDFRGVYRIALPGGGQGDGNS
ncbi:DUF3253 domain-containing protein [Zhengella sp. ZM62]|uniref:DUF3253 domain-containing protein n=1 Tax=Zhengella sedimenti TaxID=3390035 RepID=UPI0039747EA6